MANQYDIALKIAGKVDPSLVQSAKKASGLISSIVKAELIVAGIKTAANAVKNFAVSSIQSYSSFEQSLANAGAIAGATGADLQAMKKAAMDAGRTTQFTAAQSADALGYMALAGWDTKTSIQALQPVLKMAQATGADLATTSDQVTDSMSAMGIPVSELNGYLDVLVQTNNKANTTAAQLMEAMIGAGSASKAAGLDYKQTATALGVLANNGIKGAEAGTALNSMLSRMTSNKAAIDTYKELGVRVFDANGKIRDFATILRETDTALSKLSDEKRAEAIKDIAGVNYGGQYQFLLKGVRAAADGSSEWGKLAENINNAKGALNTMNDRTTATLTGAWARFQSAIDGARLALLDKFGPQITEALDYISNNVFPPLTEAIGFVTEKIATVIGTVREFADILLGVGESASSASGYTQGFGKHLAFIQKYGYDVYITLQQVREIAKTLGSAIYNLSSKIISLVSYFMNIKQVIADVTNFYKEHQTIIDLVGIAVGGLTVAILAYNAASIQAAVNTKIVTLALRAQAAIMPILTGLTSAFGAVWAFITSPIFLVVAAITAVVAAVYLLWKHWDTVSGWIKGAWQAVCNAVKGAWDWVCNKISSGIAWYVNYLKQQINAIKAVWDWLCNTITGAWNAYMAYLANTWNTIKNGFMAVGNFIVSIFTGAVDNVKIIFNGICDFISNVFSGNFKGAWDSITGIFTGVWENFKDIAKAPLNWIIEKINAVIRGMNSVKVPDWVPGLGGAGVNIQEIPALATGGIVTKPTITMVGEGKESEAVLPLSKLNSLLKAEKGTTGETIKNFNGQPSAKNTAGDNINFSPVININGGEGRDGVKTAVNEAFAQFKSFYEQLKRDERRRSFAGA